MKIGRAKAKALIVDGGGARLKRLFWHYEDGWREVAVRPEISGFREWERIGSNMVRFVGGSRLDFDGAECHYDGHELELRFEKVRMVYDFMREGL